MGKKETKLNNHKPDELEEIKSNTKKLNERVDALAELLGDLEAEVKEIKGKTYPGDIANAIREGFGNLATRTPNQVERPASEHAPAAGAPAFQFDIYSIGWKQKKGETVPTRPKWGWVFAHTQDGGYHSESEKLVKYIERYGPYASGNQTVSIGGPNNKFLQLKTRE